MTETAAGHEEVAVGIRQDRVEVLVRNRGLVEGIAEAHRPRVVEPVLAPHPNSPGVLIIANHGVGENFCMVQGTLGLLVFGLDIDRLEGGPAEPADVQVDSRTPPQLRREAHGPNLRQVDRRGDLGVGRLRGQARLGEGEIHHRVTGLEVQHHRAVIGRAEGQAIEQPGVLRQHRL